MSTAIPIANRVSIRDAGHDEYWLQDLIATDPSCLLLGDLTVVQRERQQSTGGRLDLLLKDPEDDTMYEVEIMLGDTNESHIIRTIEYWDNERRKWPKRQHIAVIIAEGITTRFYNVIHLLSQGPPLIAIQAHLLQINDGQYLHFTKILDTYEEPEEDMEERKPSDEFSWREKAAWTVETAKTLLNAVGPILSGATLRYVQEYIAISQNGSNYLWLYKRAEDRSLLEFRLKEQFHDEMIAFLDQHKMPFSERREYFQIKITKQIVIDAQAVFQGITNSINRSVNG